MQRTINLLIVLIAFLILAALCGHLSTSNISSAQTTTKASATGKAHSVIYRVRESRNGQLQSEKLVLRSVNEAGEWRQETIWSTPAAGNGSPQNVQRHSLGESKLLLSPNDVVEGSYFQPLPDDFKEKSQTRQIAGLKAYLIHSEREYLVWDQAISEETGKTSLWSRIVDRERGFEIESEALHVIWGVKNF
jgi:hypothetical protein